MRTTMCRTAEGKLGEYRYKLPNETHLLHIAALCKWKDVIDKLICDFQCDPMQTDLDQSIALQYAALEGSIPIMDHLIEKHKCNPYFTDGYGGTALHYVVRYGHTEAAKWLIDERGV